MQTHWANPIAIIHHTLPSPEASHSGHRPILVTPTESTCRALIHIAATNTQTVAQQVAFITDRALEHAQLQGRNHGALIEFECDAGSDSVEYVIFMIEYTQNNRENWTLMQSFGLIVLDSYIACLF
jgi:hypothetical protein